MNNTITPEAKQAFYQRTAEVIKALPADHPFVQAIAELSADHPIQIALKDQTLPQ